TWGTATSVAGAGRPDARGAGGFVAEKGQQVVRCACQLAQHFGRRGCPRVEVTNSLLASAPAPVSPYTEPGRTARFQTVWPENREGAEPVRGAQGGAVDRDPRTTLEASREPT